MSDALIASLNDQLNRERQKTANLERALRQERKGENGTQTLKAKLAELEQKNATLTSERDAAQQKLTSSPSEHAARVKELEGQLADRDYRDTFFEAAGAAGVRPEARGDLYALLGLKRGEQPAKAEDFADALAQAKTSRAWAFGGSPQPEGQSGAPGGRAADASQGIQLGAAKAGATGQGAGRGEPVTSANQVTYRMEEVRKPGWQRDNPKLAEALRSGTAKCLDAG